MVRQWGVRAVIGVPLYNGARHAEVALSSLAEQSGVEFAVVLVDDCSTDATPALARALAARHPHVTYERNDRRQGLVENWRRCFRLASTLYPEAEYFAWGSDHDRWEPGWLAALVEALDAAPEAVLAYPYSMRIAETGEERREVRRFETRGIAHPVRRFAETTVGISAGNMVYGLFRCEALRACGIFPSTLLPDRLLLLRASLHGEFHQVPRLLWQRRLTGAASLERQQATLWSRPPWWSRLPVRLVHAGTLAAQAPRVGGVRRRHALAAATITLIVGSGLKAHLRRYQRAKLRAWRLRKRVLRAVTLAQRLLLGPGDAVPASTPLRAPVAPEPDAVAVARSRSPLREGRPFTPLADARELRFRDEIEPELRDESVHAWMERKQVVPRLGYVLRRAALAPAGVVVELGAGSCWLAASLAALPEVERVFAVEFSRRRLEELAPQAIAAFWAPPEKVVRVLADFNDPGLTPGTADLVVTDASYHHAADPAALAAVCMRLLRPGGRVLLTREPTIARLRPGRDHGLEGGYGDFEHEYTARGYERQLRDAGFVDVRRLPAPGGFSRRRDLAALLPPLSWLNGLAFAEFAFLAVKPEALAPSYSEPARMTAKIAKAPISELRFLRDYRAWRGVVEAARAGRRPEAGIARGRELAQRYPERVEVHRTLGELYMEAGDDESSIDPFRQVLRLDPGDVKNRLRLSRALAGTGAVDDALTVMLPAVEDAPTPRNLVRLAALQRRLGRHDDAFAVLQRAVERNPMYQPALEALAGVAEDLGREADADSARAALRAVRPKLSTADVVERIDSARPGDAPRYVVNIGCRDGKGWDDPCFDLFQRGYPGVAVDAGNFPELHENLPQPEVRKLLDTPVTPGNVLDILAGAGCPRRLSLLKIDIDSFDGVVLAAALEGLRPNVIQIEINPEIPPPLRFAIEYHPRYRHSGAAGFFGCSVAYLTALCRPLGYELLEIDMSDPPLRQDVILVLREYLPIFDVTPPVDERELFLREPVALGGFRAIGVDSAEWRTRTDYDALFADVRAACEAASRRRSGEVLPFTLER